MNDCLFQTLPQIIHTGAPGNQQHIVIQQQQPQQTIPQQTVTMINPQQQQGHMIIQHQNPAPQPPQQHVVVSITIKQSSLINPVPYRIYFNCLSYFSNSFCYENCPKLFRNVKFPLLQVHQQAPGAIPGQVTMIQQPPPPPAPATTVVQQAHPAPYPAAYPAAHPATVVQPSAPPQQFVQQPPPLAPAQPTQVIVTQPAVQVAPNPPPQRRKQSSTCSIL
ncbi:hypothetical protein BSL78_12805 [Apostichopus japonicus]|uniref:Uncharacterized protein n=1 Tax=Stichopus japonicus TaxID=307972 RepID=A0A2G8KQS1_STIJA|nr:hypothetical protein BSL78_12805 [Apostichopus japonicus]